MRIPDIRRTTLLLFFSFISGIPLSAHSACKQETSDGLPYYIAELSGMKVPDFSPGNYAVGSVIYSYTGKVLITNKSGTDATYDCSSKRDVYFTGIGSHSNGIYKSLGSIQNIGIRIISNEQVSPFFYASELLKGNWNESTFLVNIELIKTGPITAAGNLSGSFAQYRFRTLEGPLLVDFRFAAPVLVSPRVPTCKVKTKDIVMEMGDVRMLPSSGVGSVSASSGGRSMQLDCSGGDKGTSTQVYVSLTDATNRSNTTKNLTLNKTSTARGIAVQVLRNGEPVSFGPESVSIDDANRWEAGAVSQGQTAFSIPLQARYVQTEEGITPGRANASEEFTIHYQ